MKINNFIFFQLLLSIFNFLWISADCQVLTPFTFGDIQRRVGDAFDVSNATTATARQSDNFQQTTFGDSLEPGTSFFKDNLGPDNFFISSNFDDDDFFKTPTNRRQDRRFKNDNWTQRQSADVADDTDVDAEPVRAAAERSVVVRVDADQSPSSPFRR